MSNFIDPTLYDTLERIPAERELSSEEGIRLSELSSYFPTVKIPVGTIMYRGDKAGPTTPSSEVPAFFTNKKSAGIYAAKKEENFTKYRVKKELKLFELQLNSVRDFVMLVLGLPDDIITPTAKKVLQIWHDPKTGAVRPAIPLCKEPIDGYRPYVNRVVADIMCDLGFDGWIVLPYNPDKKQGLVQLSLVHGMVMYSPEIMVCKWDTHLEQVKEGGRRKKTRKSKKRNATR